MSIILSLLLFVSTGLGDRLDPHGSSEMNLLKITPTKNLECKACHFWKNNKWSIKNKPELRCLECHNKKTHSGVAEHIGKSFKGKKINCLSCHRPHRARLSKNEPIHNIEQTKGFIFNPLTQIKPSEGFYHSNKTSPMIQRSCLDCHSWKKLK